MCLHNIRPMFVWHTLFHLLDAICQPWESVRFASLWSHIDLRVSAHDFGENFLRNLLKSENLKISFLLQKPAKSGNMGL